MSSSHTLLKYLRLIHLYIGVFIAPALLFFAFTGALQTFSLHETTRGSSYKPPAWAVMLAPDPQKADANRSRQKAPATGQSRPTKPLRKNRSRLRPPLSLHRPKRPNRPPTLHPNPTTPCP